MKSLSPLHSPLWVCYHHICQSCLFVSRSVSSKCILYSPCSKSSWCDLYCCWWALGLTPPISLPSFYPLPFLVRDTKSYNAARWSFCLCIVVFVKKLIAKQKVLRCPVVYSFKFSTATAPLLIERLIVKGTQKNMIKGNEEKQKIEEMEILCFSTKDRDQMNAKRSTILKLPCNK